MNSLKYLYKSSITPKNSNINSIFVNKGSPVSNSSNIKKQIVSSSIKPHQIQLKTSSVRSDSLSSSRQSISKTKQSIIGLTLKQY